MAYIPDPTDASQPVGTVKASTAAAEFRALKAYIAGIASAGYPPVAGQSGNALVATPGGGITWSAVPNLFAFVTLV